MSTSSEAHGCLSKKPDLFGRFVSLSQSFSNEGDLVVDGNGTYIVENCEYHLIGSIIVQDNATLTIRNAIFNQTCEDNRESIVVKDRGRLTVTNVTLAMSQNSSSIIMVQNEATFDMINSNVTNSKSEVYVWIRGNSIAYIENSEMRSFIEPKLITQDYSKATIKDSTLGRVVIWKDSEVFIEGSVINGALRTWGSSRVHVSGSIIGSVTAYGNLTLYIQNSIIEGDVTDGLNCDVWLVNTSAQNVSVSGDSRVWLIDTSVTAFHEHGNATVFVGWDLPLFGPIAFHHTLVPVIRLVALLSVGAAVGVVLFVVIRKLWKRR